MRWGWIGIRLGVLGVLGLLALATAELSNAGGTPTVEANAMLTATDVCVLYLDPVQPFPRTVAVRSPDVVRYKYLGTGPLGPGQLKLPGQNTLRVEQLSVSSPQPPGFFCVGPGGG